MSTEASSGSRAAPGARAGETPLIFDWSPVRWRRTRLMVALVVAAAGHVLMFYLFQVATEPSPRQAPPVRQALILPDTGEGTRRLLEQMEDRLPALNPPPLDADPEGLPLASLVKGYVPTWQDHRPSLKPMPGQGGSATPLPSLLPSPAALLPPLQEPDGAPLSVSKLRPPVRPGPVIRPQPALSLQSGLEGRQVLEGPVWPATVTADEWPEEGTASFMLSLAPDGKVESCLPLDSSAGLDESVLQAALLKMKFSPSEGPDALQWGWVDVIW